MSSQSTTGKKKPSGAAFRRRRVEKGLPPYTAKEWAKVQQEYQVIKTRTAFLSSLKVQRGCADCGYNAHAAALDFDHLPGTQKCGEVGRMATWDETVDAALAEIEKCEVVCANCHRIRTYERRKAQQG